MDDLKEKRKYWKLKRKQYVTLCGELVLEDSMDLSQGTLCNTNN